MRAVLLTALMAAAVGAAPVALKVRVAPAASKATIEVPLEKYVAAVLAGESSVLQSDEAMKAMAVAARTFAIRFRGRHAAEGYDLCGTTHCQRLEFGTITPRLESLAGETAGELIWFEGKPAFACYSRDCGGLTEEGGAVWAGVATPYLASHPDPYCTRRGASAWEWKANPPDILAALRGSQLRGPARLERIAITQRTASGRARELLLTGGGETVRISASSFRFAMGRGLGWNTVRSDRYEVAGGLLVFQGSGAGHGVGLCQRGADQMGLEGHSYREILAFYYPGTLLGLTGRGLSWTHLGGETVALLTTQPDGDRTVLALAERQAGEIARRTGLAAPGNIEIRVYPDVETFRNATGEPGWVAARTAGRRIHLQPAATLRSRGVLEETLRHELLHVFVETQASTGLPVWFREGLVGYLMGESTGLVSGRAGGPPHLDADLQQTQDGARARRAYAAAARRVAGLVNGYGEGAVLSWLRAGLPREVRNASSSDAATKSK